VREPRKSPLAPPVALLALPSNAVVCEAATVLYMPTPTLETGMGRIVPPVVATAEVDTPPLMVGI
jgi:hypothetical protein